LTTGSISPNFVCQAKRRRRTAFGKTFDVQFHQKSLVKNIGEKFWQKKPREYVGEIDPRSDSIKKIFEFDGHHQRTQR